MWYNNENTLKTGVTWRMINDKKGNKLLLAVISQGLKIKTEQYQILDFGIRIKKSFGKFSFKYGLNHLG